MKTYQIILVALIIFVVASLLGAMFTKYVFSLHNYEVSYWTALMTNLWLSLFVLGINSKSSK